MNELEQKQTGISTVEMAHSMTVETQLDYNNAAEVCKDIKWKAKQIEEYWKPLKEKAHAAWKDICGKEKQFLNPLSEAENAIKGKMASFQRAKMEQERLLKEEQERFRKEEEARLLALAVKAEEEGKDEHGEYLVEMAQAVHIAKFEQPKKVKTEGTAVKTVWKARVVNPVLVPVSIAGVLIRPIDEKALNNLAKVSKGNMEIPGVEFYEDVQIAVSRG